MWIVRLALRRPYTFPVMAILIVLLAVYMVFWVMPTDIFPEVDIPVIRGEFPVRRDAAAGDRGSNYDRV